MIAERGQIQDYTDNQGGGYAADIFLPAAASAVAHIPGPPFVGISILLAGTAYELYEACESMEDLAQFYTGLDMVQEVSKSTMPGVCNPQLQLPVFETRASRY